MGGRALKNTFTRRYERQEFEDIKIEIFGILGSSFDRFDVPRFFAKKETFGDIDIIVDITCTRTSNFDGVFIRKFIEHRFQPNEIFHNGNAWSFDYKEIQVDLICCSAKDFDSNHHYLAFNDLGNFIGRLAQSIGFKYGQEGLWYNHYSDSNTKTTIMVSKDYPKIFEFLGLDYSIWVEGFDTLENIFEYVMTSSLFNVEMFQLNKLNKINRERNIKRASYMSFLEYIEDKPNHPNYNASTVALEKSNIIEIIRDCFPEANVDVHLAEIDYAAAIKKLINTKFNGKLIKAKFDLEGKELGEAIKKFKFDVGLIYTRKVPPHLEGRKREYANFDMYILNTDIEKIYEDFESSVITK